MISCGSTGEVHSAGSRAECQIASLSGLASYPQASYGVYATDGRNANEQIG